MSILPQFMELVSLRKVCDALESEEIYTLLRHVELAKEANKSLAPNPQVFEANLSKLNKAQELLEMKATVLKEEARLHKLVADRERLLRTKMGMPPADAMQTKKIELEAITKFVNEYQRYRRTCLSIRNQTNEHRCKDCAIDNESDEEDGIHFKKKRATQENPRGSLELHLQDKVYYYLLEQDDMHVEPKDIYTEDFISSIETEISSTVLTQTSDVTCVTCVTSDVTCVTSESDLDSNSTMCENLSITELDSPSSSESFNLDKLRQLINESRKTDKKLNGYRKRIIDMCHRQSAEEKLFRQTTEELMSRYGINKNSYQTRPKERGSCYKNSNIFFKTHSPKEARRAFDNCRSDRDSVKFMAPKKYMCDTCLLRVSQMDTLQRPCASSYSARPPTSASAYSYQPETCAGFYSTRSPACTSTYSARPQGCPSTYSAQPQGCPTPSVYSARPPSPRLATSRPWRINNVPDKQHVMWQWLQSNNRRYY